MDDDLRDLLDPDDDRVASALQRIRTDLLVAPDEVTAARHRRLRRSLAERPSVRRTAVAIVLAVAGTGAALSAVATPPVVPGAPAGQDAEPHIIDTSSTVWFPAPVRDAVPDLPTYVDQLPAPAPRGSAPVDPAPEAGDVGRPDAPATVPPRSPDPLPGPPEDAPGGAPDTLPPVAPGPPATGEAPAHPDDGRPQPSDPARSSSTGGTGTGEPEGDAPAEDAPTQDQRANSAQDQRPAPPPADGSR
ncbi:hypothetical protein [Nitriliruptor alkaliphilus]|uniref:hypothetical protein n=1 Tax=Nitriliruptor alkaliphilus TaxID=427918 RepID=UPI000696EFB7|nr:hypothetical protein [Nitriliruptor alkaliphilus]